MTGFLTHFELLEEVGVGGMGTVWRARDTRDSSTVAVKVLHTHLSRDADYIRRFQREARIAKRIDSPRVVRVMESGSEGATHFLVMDYVEGKTLARLVQERGRLPISESVAIAAAIAEGLEAAHRVGIVHRDVSPQNVIIQSDGDVKVTDFGVARDLDATAMTATSLLLGKPQYIAPEIVTGRGQADIRSDIYALGIVLYQMLTGSVPFSAETPYAVMLMQASQTPPPLTRARGDVPPWLIAVVERCLAKNPADRYQTPGALAAALGGIGPVPSERPRIDDQRGLRAPRILLLVGGGLGVGVIAIASVLILLLGGRSAPASAVVPPTGEAGGSNSVSTTSTPLSAAAPATASLPTATSTMTATPAPTSTPEPTRTPALFPTPTRLPYVPGQTGDVVAYKGNLVFSAGLDGTSADIRTDLTGECTNFPDAPDTPPSVAYFPAGIEMDVPSIRGWRTLFFNAPTRVRYVVEYDLAFEQGSTFAVWASLRANGVRDIALAIWPGEEALNVIMWDSETGVTSDLTARVSVTGLQTGRLIEVAAAVDTSRIVVFLDGRQVLDFEAGQVAPNLHQVRIQGLGCNGGTGAFRVLGARLYELRLSGP